jgi:hypothetical protein
VGPRRAIGPTIAAVLAAAAIVSGSGLGAGRSTSDVSLTVTRDFGTRPVLSVTQQRVPGSETVMRMLQRSARITTRYGGGFVESIDGLSGTSSRRDWFYYVNGVQAPVGAAQTPVHRGDRIWWDLHDWSATESIPAVVGSFPEPFVHGVGGKRLPTTLECASDVQAACQRVTAALRAVGVPTASQLLGTGSGTDSLAVVVGTWSDLRGSLAAGTVERGPSASGIYAKFAGPGGSSLQLLDAGGHVARALGAGSGLIAASAQNSSRPTWLITGTDLAGVSAAAMSLTPATLEHRFALAVHGSAKIPAPVNGAS